MTTIIEQNIQITSSSSSQTQPSPKTQKKPTRNISNLADIQTINATRFLGSPSNNPLQTSPNSSISSSSNTRNIKQMQSSQAASLQVPARSGSSVDSETSSVTSYEGKSTVATKRPIVINLEEDVGKIDPDDNGIYEGKRIFSGIGGWAKSEEVKGAEVRDSYLSQGTMAFRVRETIFDGKRVKLGKNKPYYKVRLGLNSKKSKDITIEGNKIKSEEEIYVKYSNQDSVVIKVKGKGLLVDSTIAKVKISVIDVVMNGGRSETVALMKGDDIVGEMKVDMWFEARK